jgi:4-carboxymuconolactone decarboxylase
MYLRKSIGVILLAGVVGVLLGGKMIHAQNAVRSADSAPLPKDIYPDSRNRLPSPKREDMDDYGKTVFDEMARINYPAVPPSPLRLYSPKLAKPLGEAHHYLKYETELGDRLTEIAVLVTAREVDSQYEWTEWETHGRDPKDSRHVEPAIIDIIKYNKPTVGLGAKETVIIALGREMFGQRKVSSATFAETLRLFGRRGTVDLVELMALYSATAAELTAFDMQLQEGQKPLLPPR